MTHAWEGRRLPLKQNQLSAGGVRVTRPQGDPLTPATQPPTQTAPGKWHLSPALLHREKERNKWGGGVGEQVLYTSRSDQNPPPGSRSHAGWTAPALE